MAKIKDLRAKTDDQLNEQIIALKKEGMNLRFQQTSGQLTNTSTRTSQVLDLETGTHSRMRTTSPTLNWLSSS